MAVRVEAPAISRSGTSRVHHTCSQFLLQSRTCRCALVSTRIPRLLPPAQKNQVNRISFPLPQIFGERREARRTNALRLAGRRRWTGQQSTKSSTSWFISFEKCGASIVHTHWPKVFSKADVAATTFTVCCPENCSAPETLPGRRVRYIAEVSWVPSFRDRPNELGVSLVVAVNQSHRQFETRKTYYPEMFAVSLATLPKV